MHFIIPEVITAFSFSQNIYFLFVKVSLETTLLVGFTIRYSIS